MRISKPFCCLILACLPGLSSTGVAQDMSLEKCQKLKDKIEHRRVVKNEVGRALLSRLLDDGIIKLEGKFYHWVSDRADAVLKVSWDDLRLRRVTPELKAYLKRFIEDNKNLF